MRRIWKRIIAAAILSFSVYGATQYFADQFRPQRQIENTENPIAYIKDVDDEVEKRAVTSLVWKGVSTGELLHPGEAIKTSSQGEVRIQFTESSRFIDLDPDSLIVLTQEKNSEISLDLLNGSLLVGQKQEQSSAKSEPALTLKSSQGKVDLSEATAQISKSSGDQIDVRVLRGKAKVEKDGKIQEFDKSRQLSKLEILSPLLDQPLYLNPSSEEAVPFKWKGFPASTRTSLWIGKTRKNLLEISRTESPDITQLTTRLNPGNYFWKLKAHEALKGQIVEESPLFRLKIENRYPPTLVQPAHQSKLSESAVHFQWHQPATAQRVLVEISKDSALKEKIYSETFTGSESFERELSPGLYYWRLSALYSEMKSLVSSPVYSFTIGPAPEPEKPQIPVQISWLTPDSQKPLYFIQSPKAQLSWTTNQTDQVHHWRLKLADNEEALKSEQIKPLVQTEIKETTHEAPLPKPGRYLAMVEALNEKNQILASSTIQNFEVLPMPLLTSPQFEPLDGDFKTDPKGNLNLRWTSVKGAKEYWLSLADESGKEIRKARFERTATALSNLLPGIYQISVIAVDEHGRESERKPSRRVLVPESSGLQAPKLKKIEVD